MNFWTEQCIVKFVEKFTENGNYMAHYAIVDMLLDRGIVAK